MTKTRFLNDLKRNLNGYPRDFINQTIDYYSEAIADGIEDGLTEEESIKRLGSLPSILESIKENAMATSVRKVNNRFNASNIILAVILFPLWFPLAVVAFVVVWAVGLAAIISEVALAISGISVTFAAFGYLFQGLPGAFGLNFGSGLVVIGVSILLGFLVYYLVKGIVKLHLSLFRKIKDLISNGGVSYE